MKGKIESGKSNNEKITELKATDEEGKAHTERVVKDKDTGEIKSHTVDGKEVEAPKPPEKIRYVESNFEPMMILVLNQILNQLKEMNYYMSFLEKKDG